VGEAAWGCHGWGRAAGLQAMDVRRPRDCSCGAGCNRCGLQATGACNYYQIFLW
jgi:hypothetical protein